MIGFMDICFGSFVGILKVREKFKGEKFLDELKIFFFCKWVNEFLFDDIVKNVVLEIDKVVEFLGEFEVRV